MSQLIDNPDKWIIKMFKFNEKETGGINSEFYPEGTKLEGVLLDTDEMIYGKLTDNKDLYFFTQYALIRKNQTEEKIRIKDICKTNGSFRSGHKSIDVETLDGKKYKLKISNFPYRLQQLFYQLVEKHGSLIQTPNFIGPKHIREVSRMPSQTELASYNIPFDPNVAIRVIELEKHNYSMFYVGEAINGSIHPTNEDILKIRIASPSKSYTVFNSEVEGYNGVSNKGMSTSKQENYQEFGKIVSNIVLVYRYSIEDHEFEELKEEFNFKSNDDLNNLFGSIQIFTESQGNLSLLSEYETQ